MPTTHPSIEHVLTALRTQLAALRTHEPGTRAGRDPEALHQMRVAVRRLRAILRAGGALFDPRWVAGLRRELDWLGATLGAARDVDILRANLESELAALGTSDRKAGRALLRRLETDRARARTALHAALDGPRYARLLARLQASFGAPRVGARDVSLLGVAATEFRKLRRAVKRLSRHPSPDDLHEVRIRTKRARYAAELIQAAAGVRGEKFINQARKVQDILGEHQDAVVIEDYLHDVVGSREAAHALQQHLLDRQRKRRKKARAAFFEAWPKLERRGRKAWIDAPTP
jgi:CHAD domain-containing protein